MIKKILITILIILFTASLGYCGGIKGIWEDVKHPEKGWIDPANDNFFGLDKFEHGIAGFGAQTGFFIVYHRVLGISPKLANPFAFITTFGLGLSKEVWVDGKRDGASYVDLSWMVVGQGLSAIFVNNWFEKEKGFVIHMGPGLTTPMYLGLSYNF